MSYKYYILYKSLIDFEISTSEFPQTHLLQQAYAQLSSLVTNLTKYLNNNLLKKTKYPINISGVQIDCHKLKHSAFHPLKSDLFLNK